MLHDKSQCNINRQQNLHHRYRKMAKFATTTLLPTLVLLVFFVLLLPLLSYGRLHHEQQQAKLIPSSSSISTTLNYHKGSLLSSPTSTYIIWYGAFPPAYRAAVTDFFASFRPSDSSPQPTVSKWWATIQQYKALAGKPASAAVKVGGEISDSAYSLGKSLARSTLADLVRSAIAKGSFPLDLAGVYLVLTAADVAVDRFCTSSCGFHGTTLVSAGKRVVVAHVGDPGAQCPGLCAWPYAAPAYGPPGPPLVAPNGVGVDGTIVNIATVIAGAVTNPFGDGFYQGDRLAPLEAATACAGEFGEGAYPGYTGALMIDGESKASFNAFGAGGRRFLLPAIWEPLSGKCKVIG
ncbi:protein EXORDIUM-like 1 [Canna indica]|uniref:Protein EXORDIUM-like 1 n=1 Tax=Canna indica TaxID=4628 RepID=A0AAQ3QEU7_9LILI|nr:protein EXORDIUM-like 1 [Canna indica]